TLVILFAYRALAGVTSRLTASASEFTTSSETREWIESLQTAAEQAVSVTEVTKTKMQEFEPRLDEVHENYRRTLVLADMKLEKAAGNITTAAQTVRDVVAKPAFAVASFAAGLSKIRDNR